MNEKRAQLWAGYFRKWRNVSLRNQSNIGNLYLGFFSLHHFTTSSLIVPAVLIWTDMDVCRNYANGQNFVHTIKRDGFQIFIHQQFTHPTIYPPTMYPPNIYPPNIHRHLSWRRGWWRAWAGRTGPRSRRRGRPRRGRPTPPWSTTPLPGDKVPMMYPHIIIISWSGMNISNQIFERERPVAVVIRLQLQW